jgi:arabinogalactan oligomer / maltooligosaccharide transport system substrate-binding protein
MKRTRLFILGMILTVATALVSIAPALAQDDSLLIWADGTRAPLLTELGEQYEAEFGVAIEVREIGLGDARQELLNFGEAGEGPDILIQPHDNVGQLVQNGAIIPIDLGDLEDLFSPEALEVFTYEDQLWALPYQTENIALIRNTALVPEAPTTWQEVTEIGRALRDSGDAQYAFLVQTGDAYHNHPIYTAFGGYIFGRDGGAYDPGDVGFDSEGGLAAAEWYGEMYAEELMVPNVDDDVVFSLFEEGELAMFTTGPWNSTRITETAERGGIDYAIDALPGAEGALEAGIPFLGGQGFMISAFSDKQLQAQQFLFEFIATQDVMQQLSERFPVFAGVTSDDPNIPLFQEAGANSIPMPNIPEMAAVWAGAGNALTLTSQGEDPIVSFEDGAAQIREAIVLVQSEDVIVGLPGSLGDEAGCASDWDPACEATFLEAQGDDIYALTVTLPAGEYEYKVAIGGAWAENYGLGGEADGANIPLVLEEETEVTFTFDYANLVITDSVMGERMAEDMGEDSGEDMAEEEEEAAAPEDVMIESVSVPGDYQDEAGCEGDWDPACDVTTMEDAGDGTYTLTVTLPAGEYQYKAAINGTWDVNYGAEGAFNGDNIPLVLEEETEVTFTFDSSTNVISDSVSG